jgi:hypothetical protein
MGIKVKEVKKQPGLYKYSTGSDNDKTITYFKQNDDGTYSSLNTTRSVTPEASGLKGFMASDLGKLASIAAAVWGGPALGSYLAGAGTAIGGAAGLSLAAQAGLGGSIVGGGLSGLAGGSAGDILKGAALGGIGGYGGVALKELAAAQGIGGLPLMEGAGPAPIVDAIATPVSGAELLPSLGEGAFDLGGITGAGLPTTTPGISLTDLITTPPADIPLSEGAYQSSLRAGATEGLKLPTAPAVSSVGGAGTSGLLTNTATGGGGVLSNASLEALFDLPAGSLAGMGGLTNAQGLVDPSKLGGVLSTSTMEKMFPAAMGVGAGAAGATLLDKAKEYLEKKAKGALGLGDGKGTDDLNWAAILAALFGAGMGLSERNTGTQPGGYQGGIPTLTATRGEAMDPLAGGRRAGGAGIPILTGGVTYAAEGGLMDLARGGSAKDPRYLDGHTDGMADKIQTDIDGKQPARLSHGEFVIPADVVSHLGNGNSDAGAKVLYQMMAKVRRARTGNPKQGKQINPGKFVPV